MADFTSLTSNPTVGTQTSHLGTGASASSTLVDKVKEMASSVVDTTKEAASSVADKTSELASTIGHKASQAASAVEDTWETSSRYVQEKGVRGMTEDLTTLIRRHPLPALAIGFSIGLLLAQLSRK